MAHSEIIQAAVDRAGGVSALARALGIKHPAIYSWKRIPAERVPEISRVTGIPRHELRPDLYESPRSLP